MKNIKKIMMLLMLVAGGNFYSQSPSMSNFVNGKFECPEGKELIDFACCPPCPEGQSLLLAKGPIDPKKSNYPPTVCSCTKKESATVVVQSNHKAQLDKGIAQLDKGTAKLDKETKDAQGQSIQEKKDAQAEIDKEKKDAQTQKDKDAQAQIG